MIRRWNTVTMAVVLLSALFVHGCDQDDYGCIGRWEMTFRILRTDIHSDNDYLELINNTEDGVQLTLKGFQSSMSGHCNEDGKDLPVAWEDPYAGLYRNDERVWMERPPECQGLANGLKFSGYQNGDRVYNFSCAGDLGGSVGDVIMHCISWDSECPGPVEKVRSRFVTAYEMEHKMTAAIANDLFIYLRYRIDHVLNYLEDYGWDVLDCFVADEHPNDRYFLGKAVQKVFIALYVNNSTLDGSPFLGLSPTWDEEDKDSRIWLSLVSGSAIVEFPDQSWEELRLKIAHEDQWPVDAKEEWLASRVELHEFMHYARLTMDHCDHAMCISRAINDCLGDVTCYLTSKRIHEDCYRSWRKNSNFAWFDEGRMPPWVDDTAKRCKCVALPEGGYINVF